MSWIEKIINKNSGLIEDWEKLESTQDLSDAIELSKSKAVVLFKHSTRCGISMEAKERIESSWDKIGGLCSFQYLDLLNYRDVSSKIAEQLNVVHQSPQIIIVFREKVVHQASHGSITGETLEKELKQLV